jgi:hypothetical protein
VARQVLGMRVMEPSTQTNPRTLAKARAQTTVTEVKKGAHRLKKGMTRFVSHNGQTLGAVALGGITLLATGRLAKRARRRARWGTRIAAGLASAHAPLRRAYRSARRRSAGSSAWPTVALMGAGALIGTGLTMLLVPRRFMGMMKQS